MVLGFPLSRLWQCGVWLASVGVFTDNWMDIELGAHRFHKKVSKIEPDNIMKNMGYMTERTATIIYNASATVTVASPPAITYQLHFLTIQNKNNAIYFDLIL